jgi:hypothetical protein
MKKLVNFLVLSTLLVIATGCERPRAVLYLMENQTGKEIVVYPPYYWEENTLAPDEYFPVGSFTIYPYGPGVEVFYRNQPFYISMDGVKYQVDRNQKDNCLYESNYHRASDALTDSLRQNKAELVWVYELTEDYIKRQIVVSEE